MNFELRKQLNLNEKLNENDEILRALENITPIFFSTMYPKTYSQLILQKPTL